MRGLNKVLLIGRLGNNPEIRYTNSGTPVTTFNVATNENWTNKEGQKEERTEWHRIVAWAKLGEICGEYLSKGRQVFVEGRLQTRAWDDKEGHKRYTTEIVASNVQFLGGPGEKDAEPAAAPHETESAPPPASAGASYNDEDIPF